MKIQILKKAAYASFYIGHTFANSSYSQVSALLKYEVKWFCKMSISICVKLLLSSPRLTTCLRKCDIFSVGQVDTATKYSSLVHPKSIKGWRKWAIDGEQALRKRATRVTPVNLNTSSLSPCLMLALLEGRAWELLSACSGEDFILRRAAEDPRVESCLEELNFGGEVERDRLLTVEDPGSWLDISIIRGSLGSTLLSTLLFCFSTCLASSPSVKSMIPFSFWFFAASRSFSKTALVGCKGRPSILCLRF